MLTPYTLHPYELNTHVNNNTQESQRHLKTQIAPVESLEGSVAFNSYQCISVVGKKCFF